MQERIMIMVRRMVLLLAAAVTGGVLCACSGQEEPVRVSLEKREPLSTAAASGHTPVLKIGIGSMITPEDGYVYYQRLLGYLEKKMGQRVRGVDRNSYGEINELLHHGDIDAAFVCGGPYVEGKEDFGLELLVVPQVEGKTTYQSYLIVPSGSEVASYEELRGRSFAFTDPNSNSGLIYPRFVLAQKGEDSDLFFEKTIFTYGHDRSIQAVAGKIVDGAAVDSLIWEYFAKVNPKLTSQTRVVAKSSPFGIPPVAVAPHLDTARRERLREVLLNVHLDPEGKEILDGMLIERFVPGTDSAYDSIRDMRRFIDRKQVDH